MQLNRLYGKEDQKWVLIYKAIRDGFGSDHFHRYCDKQGATMTVIQSKDDSYLFGEYTSVSWTSFGDYVTDLNGPFLFTLTNPHAIPLTKYSVTRAESSISYTRSYRPTFWGWS